MEMPFLFPFEEQVNALVFDLLEAEAVVKAEGFEVCSHVDRKPAGQKQTYQK
jgi:hypothetical protein